MSRRSHPHVRVGKVSYGHGVFARHALTAGDLVGEVTGRVIDDADYMSDTCIDLEDTLSLEPEPPFCYLNHSCEPNCVFWLIDAAELGQFAAEDDQFERWLDEADDLQGESDHPRVFLECLQPIRRGEELTIDYGWPADGAIPCLCGSESCRGWIVDPEELHLLAESAAAKL